MSTEDNKTLVRRYFEEMDERRDVAIIDEFIAPDFVNHDPPPGLTPDREGLKQMFLHFLSATPDGYHVIHDVIAEGDMVVTRVTGYGTHTGELFGIPPTGKQFETEGISIRRIVNGKIAEHWAVVDMLGVMHQLGVIPEAAQA
ncbi:MAG: ester cyclase [Actinomycetota bacterium]|nr:ester cyclase [Actinomycetota bacterium]